MRIYKINKSNNFLNAGVEVSFVDDARALVSTESVNKRLEETDLFGNVSVLGCADNLYWTLENDEQLIKRIEKENFNLLTIKIS